MKKLALLALCIFSTGCMVSTKNVAINTQSFSERAPATMTTSNRPMAEFGAEKPGLTAFGLLGVAIIMKTGEGLITRYNLQDPAILISDQLTSALVQKHSLTKQSIDSVIDTKDVSKIAQSYSQADMVLDIQTVYWSLSHLSGDGENYKVHYTSKLRLIDTRDQALLAEGFCNYKPEDIKVTTYGAFIGEDAKELKEEFQQIAEYCSTQFKTEVLKL